MRGRIALANTSIRDAGTIKVGSKTIDVNQFLTSKADEVSAPTAEDPSVPMPEEEIDLNAAVDSLYRTPLDEWKLDCEANDLKLQDAARILDTIMTNGFYEESYKLAGRVFKLRTRTTVDGDRLIEMLRELRPDSEAVLSHLVSRINLSSSLSAFADKTFPHTYPSDDNRDVLDEEWKARWDFISALPQPIFLAIAQTMGSFDTRVRLSCDARALENF
jgi:hypothetical protein